MAAETQSTRFDPSQWEDFPFFRETFLTLHVAPEYRQAWRTVGRSLYLMALELPQRELIEATVTRSEIRAGIRDLRHLQGFFATVGRSYIESQLGADGVRLSQLAGQTAPRVGAIADSLEVALS